MPSIYPGTPTGNWSTRLRNACAYVRAQLNFYRIHILVFTFTPLICSGIFYAANGSYDIPYIDCLFSCVTSMAVCGLATINFTTLTPFQQFLLFFQMIIGSPITVSWVMVYIRRSLFARRFRHILEGEISRKASSKARYPVKVKIIPRRRRALGSLGIFKPAQLTDSRHTSQSTERSSEDHRGGQSSRVRVDMIRRMDAAPRLVNPSGWISEGPSELGANTQSASEEHELQSPVRYLAFSDIDNPSLVESAIRSVDMFVSPAASNGEQVQVQSRDRPSYMFSEPPGHLPESPSEPERNPLPRSATITLASQGREDNLSRTQTIEFASSPRPPRDMRSSRSLRQPHETSRSDWDDHGSSRDRRSMRRPTLSLQQSMVSNPSARRQTTHAMHSGFGGFPMPHEIFSSLFHWLFPQLERRLTRTMTIPRTRTIVSQHGSLAPSGRPVTYISFDAVVGRNSTFRGLTHDQLEELGGVEYRALSALLWIVGGYHVFSQLLSWVVIASYMSIPRWSSDFRPPQLHQNVSPIWFSAFQVVSAYTNSGTSLEDESMIPFQRAYPMIFVLIFLILAGNTAFPIFLRFIIWLISKVVRQGSRVNETLHFLLDHPRRCFIYLFPSHQTWLLLMILLVLNLTDWVSFLVLDLGNPTIMSIPIGVRVVIGTLQAVAVRSAGFSTVNLSDLAPAVKALYLIMMYISVYPVAMSVRSTNVYEEKSLGVFEDDEDSVDDIEFSSTGDRVTVWGRYLAMHMRRQLSFDMWWLALAVVLVCIVEKDSLEDASNATWFNIFRIMFEIVSAYGTVGLSLGVPYDNFSFSGALRPLSKLIICAVMLRGRHRGLPVAIDRAVMLPLEFSQRAQDNMDETIFSNGLASPSPTNSNAEGDQRSQFRSPRAQVQSQALKSPARESLHSRTSQAVRVIERDSREESMA